MPRWLKHFLFVVFLVTFAGCAGSCSGCSGCGITPLPGGFPKESRIDNSTSVRVTKTGLEFIAQNIGGLAPSLLGGQGQVNAGVVTFDIPTSDADAVIGKVKICPNGSNPASNPPECVAEADLSKAKLTIGTAAPHNIKVGGTLAVRMQKVPIKGSGLLGWVNSEVVLTKGGVCNPKEYADIPVNVDISLEVDKDPAHGSRQGYTKVKILKLEIDNGTIGSSIKFCGSGFDDTIINLVKPLLINSLLGGITGTLTETLEDQLCTKQDPAAGVTCPAGSYPDADGVCRYCTPNGSGQCPNTSAECVGVALGIDGNINLSSALSSLSPGTKGGFDFLAALGGEGARDDGSGFAWGDLNPVGGGMSVGMMGGAEPKPITQCVPIANLTKPTNIPIPDELQDASKLMDNGIPNWSGPGPHFGVAVNERYMNYALGAVYNSGALCLGIGSSTLGSLLNSDTIGLLIPSFKDLARQKAPAPLALVLRPQEPPSVVVGKGTDLAADPLLKVTMNKLEIDFYVWSSDRFIRAFTAGFDITAPVNLDVTAEGLAPVLDKVSVTNPILKNSLLREDEKQAAKSLADIVASQIGTALGGAINPIDVSSQLSQFGLALNIPPSVQGQGSPGLTKLEKGTDRYLALFAGFSVAPATPGNLLPDLDADTSAEVADKRVLAEGLSLPTLRADNVPEIELRLGSNRDDGTRLIEWQYRLNGGLWHPWTYDRAVKIRAPELSIQMKHKVEVRSRIVGQPASMDRTPAVVEVRIDKTPPEVSFAKRVKNGALGLEIKDVVSERPNVKVRWALDDDAFGEWTTADALASLPVDGAAKLRVEAVDEEGNVAQKQHNLINGKEDASLGGAGSGCNCTVTGASSGGLAGWHALLGAFGLGLGMFLRRSRRPAPARRPARRGRVLGSFALMALASSWSGCSCSDDSETAKTKPQPKDNCPGLDSCELLEPGLVGAYASAAVGSDGSVWVAGYNDLGYGTSVENGSAQYVWGDLVVGKWDGTKVDWQSVDGLPSVDPDLEPGDPGGPPDPYYNDQEGFRAGLTEPGDDVGLWTSIALSDGQPRVAYFDAKNRALKFASYDGKKWAMHQVQQKASSDIGRYAKLLLVGGKAVVAYLFMEPGANGAAKSGVRVATASSASPAAASDWTFTDVYTDESTPCRAFLCASGECRADTLKCEPTTTGCTAKCGTDEKCFDTAGTKSCQKIFAKTYPDAFPEAAGLYVSLAETKSGLGLVFYDRIHGNLMAARQEGGSWQPATLVAGQGTDANGPIDTGDVGIGASLFVDAAGDWHVSYVNGFDETVIYTKITGGTTVGTPEVVDDGVVPGGQAVVGADSSIAVAANGDVVIAYQDATRGKARWATGTASGGTHTWTKKDLNVSDFAGGFNKVLPTGEVMTWWRRAKPRTEGDIAIVKP
ncbi:MAG: hypothetical protein HS104_12785 [Polyangiaceae bacterium]|nr:hypothetical protein [Polyangiaceae bacterium]MCL4752033.1 hypothetical protein [Myxococcales bacterium]